MSSLPYWSAFLLAGATTLGIAAGGIWMVTGVAILFVAVPLLEPVLGRRTDNRNAGPGRWRFDVPLFVWVPCQLALQIWGVSAVLSAGSWPEAVLGTASVGLISGGLGINIAHELVHRPGKSYRALAEVLMTSVTYPHFCVEHVHGHHRNVATPLDPASSRIGEGLYGFLPRTIIGGLRSAWRIENARAKRKGISRWSLRHRMTRYAVSTFAMYAALAAWLGPWAVAYWFGQSAIAVVLLEIVNYIEHYGLERTRLPNGAYERVRPRHSWNANHRLSNWLLFNLQRHSDHHFAASRSYDALRDYERVPQLPAGYATMMLLALVPAAWHRVMNPKAAAWREVNPSDAAAVDGASAVA